MTEQAANGFHRARAEDAEAIEGFLSRHSETSMFLRSNLAEFGIGNVKGEHATDYVLWRKNAEIRAVFGLTNFGYLLVQMPRRVPDLASLIPFWRDRSVLGMSGAADQVDPVLSALGVQPDDKDMVGDEPLLVLDLNELGHVHDNLRHPNAQDREMLLHWFASYGEETGLPFSKADIERRTRRALTGGLVQILENDGQPVAMTSVNAFVEDTIQIGGVFVPRAQRNRGYGRRVVAAQLVQARGKGVRRAILFAANQAAETAYLSIGFRHIGTYRVVMFNTLKTIERGR